MFSFQSIKDYHQFLDNNPNGCEIAIEHYINVIHQNKHLNCFVEIYESEALEMAKKLDSNRKAGISPKKLHGVIIAIKDVICYKDHKVTAASAILSNFTSTYNASAIQFLLDEEAIIIGSCNCDEFAMGSSNENSVYGNVLNAIDNSKVPGGSSGGSAVAVQANLCMLSLGSDTGGSVRQPADFCGIIGLKPGYGTVSRYGLIAYASSFDQIGIFGKNINDVALTLEVISQPDNYDSTMNIHHDVDAALIVSNQFEGKKYKIAIFPEVLNHPSLDKEIATRIRDYMNELKADGHEITEINFDLLDYIVPAYYVLTAAEASSNLSRYDGIRFGHVTAEPIKDLTDFYTKNRTEGFGKEVKRRIMLGNFVLSSGYYDAYYSKAQQVRRLLVDQINSIFQNCDAILMPTSPTTAFPIGEKQKDPIAMYLADIFTVFSNLTGVPAIAIPLFSHSNGMPFGIQLLCNRDKEMLMLEISKSFLSTLKKEYPLS